jgi:hypothetical protein
MKQIFTLFLLLFAQLGLHAQSPGNALNFDGVNDRVDLALPAIFTNINTNDFTIEVWVNPTASVFSRVLFAQENATEFVSLSLGAANTVYFYLNDGQGVMSVNTSASLSLNTWTHVACVWKAATNTQEVYFNGILQPGVPGGGSSTGTDNVMTLGSRTNAAQFFTGSMDEIRIWSRALDGCDILFNMQRTVLGNETGLVGAYNFNQGSASAANPTATSLPDLTAAANNGTLVNFGLLGATSNWITATYTVLGNLVNNTITASSTTLQSNTANATYQWIDCNNANAAIAGANSASFTPSATGSYAVVLSSGTCADTSACQSFTLPVLTLPELFYYRFDETGTTITNYASNPPVGTATASIVGTGHSQGGTGQCNTGLVGTGTSSTNDYVNTNWVTSLSGSWTISFWSSNIAGNTSLWYIFGDPNAGSLRCFTNGVAGANNWILRGPMSDIIITGGATPGNNLNTFVYDETAGQLRGYLNGTLVNTVTQATPIVISGPGPFKVGAYSGNSSLNGTLDEFRMYNRALSAAEVAGLLNPCVLPPQAALTATDLNICPGESVTFTGSATGGVAPYSYAWSDGSTTSSITVTPAISTFFFLTVTDAIGATSTVNEQLVVNIPTPAQITTTSGGTELCPGNTTTLTANNAMLAYFWDNGETTSSIIRGVGTHCVTITDNNGCTASTCAVLTNYGLPPLVITPTSNQTMICPGTTTNLSASTGYAIYNWSDGSNGFSITASDGTFAITVTSSQGCTVTESITISLFPGFTLSTQVDATTCGLNNGTALATATGTGTFSYLWSNGATDANLTGLTAGNYNVTVTDANSCTQSSSVNVAASTSMTLVPNNDLVSCAGASDGELSVSVTGGASPYTYSWGNGSTTSVINGLAPGSYVVTVTDSDNCFQTTLLLVDSPDPLAVGTAVTNIILPASGSAALAVIGGTAPYSYTWSNGTTDAALINITTPGNYAYTVTDSNGCTSSGSVDISILGSNTNLDAYQWVLFPNPTSHSLNIRIDGMAAQTVQVQIIGLDGKLCRDERRDIQAEFNVDVQQLPQGTYLLRIVSDEAVLEKRFVKQ